MTDAHNAAAALRMNSGEKRAAISLAAIYALRMLGLKVNQHELDREALLAYNVSDQ